MFKAGFGVCWYTLKSQVWIESYVHFETKQTDWYILEYVIVSLGGVIYFVLFILFWQFIWLGASLYKLINIIADCRIVYIFLIVWNVKLLKKTWKMYPLD